MRKLLLLGAIFLSQLVTTQVQGFEVEGRVAYLYPTEKNIRETYGKNGFAEYQIEVGMPLDFLGDCCCDSPIAGFFNVSYFEKSRHQRCRFEKHFEQTVPTTPLACKGDTDDDLFKCLGSKNKIEHWLITAGAKYYFECFECIRPYLGFGIGAAGVRLRERTRDIRDLNGSNVILIEDVGHHRNKDRNGRWGFALLAKSGIEYDITCNIFLDAFVDYSHSWFSKEHKKKHSEFSGNRHRNTDFGAVKAGLGLGYRF